MGLVASFAKQSIKYLAAACLAIMMAAATLSSSVSAGSSQAGFNSTRDCDGNAVMYCGAMSTSEVQQKYNADPSARALFLCYGIDSIDINNLGNTAVNGQVTNSGDVTINGNVVAVSAQIAVRQYVPGSTPMNCGGTVFYSFYQKPNSYSFVSSPQDAFVVMNNGQFSFAIIASCGNPVIAVPFTSSSPAASPTTPASPVVPASPSQTTPSQQQEQPAPQSTQNNAQPQSGQQQLPNTGNDTVGLIGVFGITSIAAGVCYWLFMRRGFNKT